MNLTGAVILLVGGFLPCAGAVAGERNCTDFLILGVGPQANSQGCREGDVVKLPYKRVPELCNFDKSIACEPGERGGLCYCVLKSPAREKR
ncbi:MAG TPA: hypothetical protein EYP40_11880 [Chromatiales bacterium]|nr:hypothetical protein [Chromatiales bacterium]